MTGVNAARCDQEIQPNVRVERGYHTSRSDFDLHVHELTVESDELHESGMASYRSHLAIGQRFRAKRLSTGE